MDAHVIGVDAVPGRVAGLAGLSPGCFREKPSSIARYPAVEDPIRWKIARDTSPRRDNGDRTIDISPTGDRPDLHHAGSRTEGAAGESRPQPRSNRAWVPIRSLARRHRRHILDHLLALEPRDRYLRFGYLASDEQITRYVERLDFDRDEIFGIFSRGLALIAVAHLAHAVVAPQPGAGNGASEFGVSVRSEARGRGHGMRLFRHAMLHARNRGVRILLIHALSENIKMLRIARAAGATVALEGSEADAFVTLPPDTLRSHVGEMVGRRAAELNHAIKCQARRARKLMGAITRVRLTAPGAEQAAED